MAEMIASKDPSDPAERWVFETLERGDHTRNWTVFYSYYVTDPHTRKTHEIDFVVLIPYPDYCVICLEVKGSSFIIDGSGTWRIAPGGPTLRRSPHDQAATSMYALKNSFVDCFHPPGQLSIECAVAFKNANQPTPSLPPHVAKSIWAPDVQDGNRLVKKLKDIARTSFHQPSRKAQEDLINLRQKLEPWPVSITRNRIFSSDLETLREELLVLTNDQLHSLELVNDNDCCVITGAAGTGKTVLALELARQRCEGNGDKVALICSNPYLSSRFVRWVQTLSDQKGGAVVAGTPKDLLKINSQKQERFSYLIVDEAQNLCDEKSLSSMDQILEGGLTDGYWTMFGDFEYQNIIDPYITETGEEVLERLRSLYPRMTRGRLKVNCRNTYEIAAAVSMVTGLESLPLPRLGVHGPLIQTKYFDSKAHLDDLLDDLVKDLKDREFFSRQIILLSSSSDDFNTVLADQYGGWKLCNVRNLHGQKKLDREQVPDVSGDSSPKTLRYSDIHEFQGLESEVVILVMPPTGTQAEVVEGRTTLPNYEHLRRVLYTGMSRAKAILVIVADESYKEHLDLEPRFEPTYEEFIESIDQDTSKA